MRLLSVILLKGKVGLTSGPNIDSAHVEQNSTPHTEQNQLRAKMQV